MSQICEAAEVSESTFFRYFGSKEAVVIRDDFDEMLAHGLRDQPPELNPIQAMRRAVRSTFSDITAAERADTVARAELFFSVPELRAAAAVQLLETIDLVAVMLGERMGRASDELGVRTLAGAVVGALMAVILDPRGGMLEDWIERVDAALGQLEGLVPG